MICTESEPPTWATAREVTRVIRHPPYLCKSLWVSVTVGTVLFAINQLDVVLRGDATASVWAKTAITYLVPFAVSNYGILVSSYRRREPQP
jgi:hypothetical protein